MRIAQIAPLWEPTPPRFYGGTELVVHLLTEALVKLGHEVTLFAPRGSMTNGRLSMGSDFPLRDSLLAFPHLNTVESGALYPGSAVSIYYELQLMNQVYARADEFDVLHNHIGYIALPFAQMSSTPTVTTLHGAFKTDRLKDCIEKQYYEAYAHLPYVSISNYQQIPSPHLNYLGTVYHGLDVNQYEPSLTSEDKTYLAFLGRFCRDKGPHHAIQAALQTGWNLLMAGKVDCEEEQEFFATEIEPYIDGKQIQYIGELAHKDKVRLLKNAAATLCPVNWPEPFGLVLIESLACGTPVLAFRNGSIPEIIQHEKTGFIVENESELIAAIADISKIDRRLCRYAVETRFTVQKMAQEYVSLYETLTHPRRALQNGYSQPASMALPKACVRPA